MKERLTIKNFEKFIEQVPVIKQEGEKHKRPKTTEFIERLTDSKTYIASHFDVHPDTLRNWMRKSGYGYLIEVQPKQLRPDYKQIKEDTKDLDKILEDLKK